MSHKPQIEMTQSGAPSILISLGAPQKGMVQVPAITRGESLESQRGVNASTLIERLDFIKVERDKIGRSDILSRYYNIFASHGAKHASDVRETRG